MIVAELSENWDGFVGSPIVENYLKPKFPLTFVPRNESSTTTSRSVKYTDVDYEVYTDAAALLLNLGLSSITNSSNPFLYFYFGGYLLCFFYFGSIYDT